MELLRKSLEEYEELCRANCELADAEMNLQQNLALKDEAIQQAKEEEIANLPPAEREKQLNMLKMKADKLNQLAEDASIDAVKAQRDIEIATKTEENDKKKKAEQTKANNLAEQQKYLLYF